MRPPHLYTMIKASSSFTLIKSEAKRVFYPSFVVLALKKSLVLEVSRDGRIEAYFSPSYSPFLRISEQNDEENGQDLSIYRFGIVVSKKVSKKAVDRNFAKRRIKEGLCSVSKEKQLFKAPRNAPIDKIFSFFYRLASGAKSDEQKIAISDLHKEHGVIAYTMKQLLKSYDELRQNEKIPPSKVKICLPSLMIIAKKQILTAPFPKIKEELAELIDSLSK